jgi:Fur family ferric uptake transcriptional regulator
MILVNQVSPTHIQDIDRSGLGNLLVAETRTADELTPLSVSETPELKFREFLEIRGEKLTEPRRVLVRHIFDTHKHFDADELVRDVHDAGHAISRATVYRTLRLLVEAGLLRELRLTNRSAYEHDYGYPNHDHMHCTVCNRVVEFRNEEILKIRDLISRAHGFRASGHRFLISGVCSACSRAHSPRRRLDLI